MIKVYVLDSNVEEIALKGCEQITNEEFKVFGKAYSIKELEDNLNYPYRKEIYNQYKDHIRFIEEEEDI